MDISLRGYNGPTDHKVMHTIRKVAAIQDQVDPTSTCENIPTLKNIQESTEHNPNNRFLFITAGGEVIGYAQMGWWAEADGTWVYLHNEWVLPIYRTPKILSLFLNAIQQHLMDLATLHGHTATAVFATNTSETEAYKSDMLLFHNYKLVWTMVEMEFTEFASLKLPADPVGIAVQPPNKKQYHDIWSANNNIYKGTWGSIPVNEADFGDFVARSLRNPELCVVAMHGNQLAGFVLSFIQNGVGVIDEVTTVSNYQKRGIGGALLTQSLLKMHKQGIKTARLHTDAANGAGGRSLYEKIGFQPVKLHHRYRKHMMAVGSLQ